MGYSDGYSKSVSQHDAAESRASTICAFIPFVNIGVAIGKMLGGSVTNGFHERKRFMQEWARDEDYLFYQFLNNSYDDESKFTTEKTAYIPCCPESGDDPNLVTSSRSEVYRKADYNIFCKDRSIETLEGMHDFNITPSMPSLDYLNMDFGRDELPSLLDVKREFPDLYAPPKIESLDDIKKRLNLPSSTPKFDPSSFLDITPKRDNYLDNLLKTDWEDIK